MGRLLVLGGTAWLGREIAGVALERGDEVVCLARGEAGQVADGAQLVVSDRDAPGAYDAVSNEDWDDVVDVSWQPGQVRSAVAALGDRARHWTYVSSCSVYADHSVPGAGEDAALLEPLAGDVATQDDYGEAKVACEHAVTAALGERALLVRAGLIGGPGDASDRFGYWVGRFAHAGSEPVLAPDAETQPSQVIDVRDLAQWVVASGRAASGPVNLVGERRSLGDMLSTARQTAGADGDLVLADPKWLQDKGVDGWAGPVSLPLWTPWPPYAGFGARSDARSTALGLTRRPLAETMRDTLQDELGRGLDRIGRKAGLDRATELNLLRQWASQP